MARQFDPGNSEYLLHNSAVVTAAPFSIAAWVKLDQLPSAFGDEFTIVNIADLDDLSWTGWNFRADDGTDAVQFNVDNGASGGASSTADVTAGVWESYCAVEIATNSRAVYLNGGNKGTDATSSTPQAGDLDGTIIGAFFYAGAYRDFTDGQIAEVAIWNVALTDAEALVLSKGFSPLFVHPQNLVAYWPLIRGLNDKVGGYNVTATGTVVSPHPPIIYSAAPYIITAPAAVGDLTINVSNGISVAQALD